MKVCRTRVLTSTILALSFTVALIFPFSTESQSYQLPKVISTVSPVIPRVAALVQARGNVIVELHIDATGAVSSAKIIDGHPLLRKSTENAALGWRFAPAANFSRTVQLTFVYPSVSLGFDTTILVAPYQMELKAKLEAPPDTISYVPSDFVLGKSRCQVHGTLLKKDKVEIVYGLVGFKVGYIKAQQKLFPNSNKETYGGCTIDDESPKYAEIVYCRKCRVAESIWSKAHQKDKRYSTAGA